MDWASSFTCTLFDGETSIEWFRPRISTRNIASVFPNRPRYVLIDTTAHHLMLVPGTDGFFRDLQEGHAYMVPEVKEATASSAPPATRTVDASPAAVASGPTPVPSPIPKSYMPPPSANARAAPARGMALSFEEESTTSTPEEKKKWKTSLKSAKEKVMTRMAKKTPSNANVGGRASPSDDTKRRRSSTTPVRPDLVAMPSKSPRATVDMSAEAAASQVRVELIKEQQATSANSREVVANLSVGEKLVCVRVDDALVEVVLSTGRTAWVLASACQVETLETPTPEQRALIGEIVSAGKRNLRKSLPRRGAPQSQSLSRVRIGGDDDVGSVSQGVSPSVSEEYGDEKLDPLSLYGKPIEECFIVDDNPIPGPIRKCIEFFRRADHIKFEGIFRVPGSSNAVVRIKNRFLVGKECTYDIPDDENPTVVASALKTYLFELPVPLIPSTLWYSLVTITDDRNFSLDDALDLVAKLPSDHVPILYYVLDFLAEVAEHQKLNKMSPANLGMVFGVVLLQPPDNNLTNIGSSMPKEVCTFLVENVNDIFEDASEEEEAQPRKPSSSSKQGRRSGNNSEVSSDTFDE